MQKVYDNLDFQRGVQAYLNSIQIASMYGMRKGILEFGPTNTTALLFETLMDSKALWLTPNTTSVYMVSWLGMTAKICRMHGKANLPKHKIARKYVDRKE
ncbi:MULTISPECIES: hypothetical protein [unclassified Methanosarcina]|uniref:hypothetical protein n=1 Tax=unclassified Methanosarcina TaxID=2644672 RepID=UPI0006157949|nr:MULTISPECIES: hypothetical protein [unclassified Methanosarcina]AKB18148.1 hypothetical protein MSWHS_1285 [Methanosarcina sp. WWM596]AKB21479.1 hypothetical protein MSWH1_1208 [Methanosarcina sp. WH1]